MQASLGLSDIWRILHAPFSKVCHLIWPVVLHVIRWLLRLLHLLPPLLFASWVSPRSLISAADWLKVLSSGEVGLAVGHWHAGVGRAVLMEGVRVRWWREGKGAVASTLMGGIQDVLIAAGNLAAELHASRQHRWRLICENGRRQALGAAQPTRVHRGLTLERRAEGWAHWGAVLGAVGWDRWYFWDFP